jgi:hypothetical protein
VSERHEPTRREIDWPSAEVRDRELTVGLDGSHSKAWTARLESILERLDQPGNPWGRVRTKKRRLKVSALVEGEEARLRHFLEAAVQQANADIAVEPSRSNDRVAPVDQADERMTEAFRGAGDPAATATSGHG